MKNLDVKSILLGILGSLFIFILILYGIYTQDVNLGDIKVKSIVIEPDSDVYLPFRIKNHSGRSGTEIGFNDLGGSFISTYSSNGRVLVDIDATKDGDGLISTYSSNGSKIITIASTEGGVGGNIAVYNKHNKMVATLQANKKADGAIVLYDRNGDYAWIATGKK